LIDKLIKKKLTEYLNILFINPKIFPFGLP